MSSSKQRDSHPELPDSVKGITSHIAHLVGNYQERVSAFNQAVEDAENMCKQQVEPFLEKLIVNVKDQGIIARLEVQQGPDDQELYPRRITMVIDQINGTHFTDVNSTPTFVFICSGYKGGGINISSYAPNASRLDLGKIQNDSSNVEKELEHYLMKGFERLFKVL